MMRWGRDVSRLYLLRHGQTEFNLQGRVQGRCDAPLTELGIEQAHGAAAWLVAQGVRFDRICSSPLGRARSTAVRVGLARAKGRKGDGDSREVMI